MAKGCLSFSFSYEEDKREILCNGPWVVGKNILLLHKWSPNMNPQDESMIQAPVWIRLPGLPLEFWVEDMFQGIANAFDELSSVDPDTVSRRRLTYARIYVGVFQGVDMPEVISLKSKLGTWQ